MSPELEQCYEETRALQAKVAPLFDGVNSFTMMMVLADLVAQWIRSHPPQEMPRLGTALIEVIGERLDVLQRLDEEETLH